MTDWDRRFLVLAVHVSAWSKDPSTKCGAVVVRPDRTIASVGFNGFPRGCYDAGSLYADRQAKLSRIVHAEANAIIHAREPLHGYTLYVHSGGITPTCDRCATLVIQAGIARVVGWDHLVPARWAREVGSAREMYAEAGVEVSLL